MDVLCYTVQMELPWFRNAGKTKRASNYRLQINEQTAGYVVELCADFEERLVRNKSENRLLYKESKRNLEWSEAEMRKTSEKYRLNSYDGESLPFENYMKIDNTSLAPDEVAKMIQTHFAIDGRKE